MAVRVLVAVAGFTAVLTIAACSRGDTVTQSATTPSETEATTASTSTPQSDKVVGPAPADRDVTEPTGLVSPTGNVSCMIAPDWARCDIIDRDWTPPPRPADCEFDYGQGISLAPGEQAEFVCAGDTAFGPDEVLPYGQSITAGVLRCESAQSWITCRDVRTGHGFSISREAYRLF
jgi:hypothetical protein